VPQATKKKPQQKGSNILRWFSFIFLLVIFCGMLATLFTPSQTIEEVPLSDVIARANDENGDIAKITVEGSTLKITKKIVILKLPAKMLPARSTSRGSSTIASTKTVMN
jgi:hypothetical protein